MKVRFNNSKRSIQDLQQHIADKGLSYVSVLSVQDNIILLLDSEFGEYKVDRKAFCPGQVNFPLHKNRRFKSRVDKYKREHLGQVVNGLRVIDVFYGPDRGYKNRSFYLEYTGACGHTGITTKTHAMRYRKTLSCHACSHVQHGERAKENGVIKKRTPTYVFWINHNKQWPEEYKDFYKFRMAAGDKPFKKAEIVFVDGKPVWLDKQIDDEYEVNLIGGAMRQAFRHSRIYKAALAAAAVETETGTQYRCAMCQELFKRKDIQVDHIDPVKPLDGSCLKKEQLIERIWTNSIAILDKKCHAKKSREENSIRKRNKEGLKNGKRSS